MDGTLLTRRSPTRRWRVRLLLTAAVLAVGGALLSPPAAQSQGQLPPYNLTMTSILALLPDGRLDCYGNTSNVNGPTNVTFQRTVRNDFRNTRQIFSTSNAVYRIDTAGHLWWHRLSTCSDPAQAPRHVGGPGWDGFRAVFGGENGVIYALRQDNTLVRQTHLGYLDGTWNWTPWQTVRTNWNYQQTFIGSGNTLYGLDAAGGLWWHGTWGPYLTAGTRVGHGWNRFNRIFGGQDGVIFGQEPGGDLYWYRHLDHQTGGPAWLAGGGVHVDVHWYTWLFPTVTTVRTIPANPCPNGC